MLTILHHDSELIAVCKPPGLLAHRSPVDRKAHTFLLQELRDQLGRHVYPVHRLDRPTSGIMLFALNTRAARLLAAQFAAGSVDKTYLTLMRGWPHSQTIDYPLQTLDAYSGKKNGGRQTAKSRLRILQRFELPIENRRHATTRLSLAAMRPENGRRHQLRRHAKHIFHPILGDTAYGDLHRNRGFAAFTGVSQLWLHAFALTFSHPHGARMRLCAPLPEPWSRVLRQMAAYRHESNTYNL